ncbi:MAG TPA: lytic transglycosylase [Deltaproteobacteria bacterium]|nr:lytic transglycosylase [Deltaproteobacteria bacterium]
MTVANEETRKRGNATAGGFLLVVCLLLSVPGGIFAQGNASQTDTANIVLQKRIGSLEKRLADLEKEAIGLRSDVASLRFPSPPETLVLCDKPIPLGRDDVRERFDREFYLILENRGLLTILTKRYAKFFPSLLEEIEKFRFPSDLIYLAVAESYLNPRVVSTAGAGGMWQFIKETGKREGLFIGDGVDERYSIPLSTYSALFYLRRLYGEFGDWFLAMAAYNCGEARVREAIANQNTRDFFDLFLPEETERYVMRIGAFKELLSNPRKYGFNPEKKDYYPPYSVCDVIITTSKDLHTAVLAQAMDLPYKAFRDNNLHLRRYTLSKGTYHIFLPTERREAFLRRIRAVPGVSLEKDG